MAFNSVEQMLRTAEDKKISLAEAICLSDLPESGLSPEASHAQMKKLWQVMLATSEDYKADDRSNSRMVGGDAEKIKTAAAAGRLIGDSYFNEVIEEALKTAECNACMKRIVAAPTAGSCGVLPAVLIPLYRRSEASESQITDALYVAAGFGQITAARASVSGAEGGCQAEIGTASAMAAAALTYIKGGTGAECACAFAIALGNLLGLVCDPVAGLVEVPCVKRNATGAVNAITAANMALAGITSRIPADEVIDAMGAVGDMMHANLRETGIGGLAGTPTGIRIAESLRTEW